MLIYLNIEVGANDSFLLQMQFEENEFQRNALFPDRGVNNLEHELKGRLQVHASACLHALRPKQCLIVLPRTVFLYDRCVI